MYYRKFCYAMILVGLFLVVIPAQAYPLANWSPPENLSDWQESVAESRLVLGNDGTQAAFWIRWNGAGTQWSTYAARPRA